MLLKPNRYSINDVLLLNVILSMAHKPIILIQIYLHKKKNSIQFRVTYTPSIHCLLNCWSWLLLYSVFMFFVCSLKLMFTRLSGFIATLIASYKNTHNSNSIFWRVSHIPVSLTLSLCLFFGKKKNYLIFLPPLWAASLALARSFSQANTFLAAVYLNECCVLHLYTYSYISVISKHTIQKTLQNEGCAFLRIKNIAIKRISRPHKQTHSFPMCIPSILDI